MAKYKFSPSALAFYDVDFAEYTNLPHDLVDVTKSTYQRIQNELAQGRVLSSNSSGHPVTVPYNKSLTVSEARRIKQNQINAWREEAFSKGFVHNGVLYDGDEQAKANISGVVAALSAGIPLPEGFTWRSKLNQNIPMDAEGLVQLGAALMQFQNEVMTRSWVLKDYVKSLQTVEDIEAVTWETEV